MLVSMRVYLYFLLVAGAGGVTPLLEEPRSRIPFVLAKTHKTGSTTVAAPLRQGAEARGYRCFVPPVALASHVWDWSAPLYRQVDSYETAYAFWVLFALMKIIMIKESNHLRLKHCSISFFELLLCSTVYLSETFG